MIEPALKSMEVRHAVRKISELRVNPSNPRVIRDKRFKELKASIEQDPKMMEARPLCVSMHPDRVNMIVGGNQRYQAVKSLGWKEVPVAELYDGTEEEEKRWMLKDNQSWGEHDWDKLANDFDLDFLKSAGFDEKELDKILGKQDHSEDDEFDVDAVAEAIKEPITKRGDIWQLGRHRLLCGDSTKKEDVMRLMDGKKADMIFTDPPYALFGNSTGIQGVTDDKMVRPFFLAIFQRIREFTKTFGHIYVCCDWHSAFSLQAMAQEAGLRAKNLCIWDKGDGGVGGMYQNCYEMIWFFSKPIFDNTIGQGKSGERTVNGKPNIWRYGRTNDGEKLHNAQKPLEMLGFAIKNSSDDKDLVLDLFGGSGSTLIACEQTGRTCYMMEIDYTYCDVIINRFEAKTGIKAVKIA